MLVFENLFSSLAEFGGKGERQEKRLDLSLMTS